jgi:hypothetical protein
MDSSMKTHNYPQRGENRVHMRIRMPEEMRARIERLASEEARSLSGQILVMLRDQLRAAESAEHRS